jgi:metallo-beta-lactamase family protein
MTSPTLTFLGAAGTVTGSRFLVETAQSRVLVDAGLYQGLKELRRRNWEEFPVDPATLDAVVLTHAHLDHSGYLPRLVREGLSGPVVCTAETAEMTAIILRDSAHLQEEDAAYANQAGFARHEPALPLYDAADVDRTLPLLRPVPLHEAVPVGEDVTVTLRAAGHILGSASLLVDADGTTVLFTGDLGRTAHPVVPDREDPAAADVVVTESTYGDRVHPAADSEVLAAAVRRTLGRGGSVLVPAFAVDRTEVVLVALGELMRSGRIPAVPVYVDSPMAVAALEVYRRALAIESFGVPDLRVVRTAEESRTLNVPARPCIVISASGMATGGRVLHHLDGMLPDPRHSVVLTGYQAVGTRGRALAEGARQVKIHGRYVPVRAEVVLDPEFSVHADSDEILGWLARLPRRPRVVYVVHGEPEAATALAARVADELGWTAVTPRFGERVRLD